MKFFKRKQKAEPQAEPVKPIVLKGLDWTPDALIIAALIKRLGGEVEIDYKEIVEVQSLIIRTEDKVEKLKIKVVAR